jgi:hypothetical protein
MFCSHPIDTSRVERESRIDIGLICLLGPMGDSIHMLEVGHHPAEVSTIRVGG